MLTIVSGLPRSGTSMMMRVLAAAGLPTWVDGLRPSDRHNPFGYFEYSKVRSFATDASWVRGCQVGAMKVVAPLIVYWPSAVPARILYMRRSIEAVWRSQQRLLGRANDDELDPTVAMTSLRDVDEQTLSHLEGRPELTLRVIGYEETLRNPTGLAEGLSEWLGVERVRAMAAAIVDPGQRTSTRQNVLGHERENDGRVRLDDEPWSGRV